MVKRFSPLRNLAAAATSLLFISLNSFTTLACRDPGVNICASGEESCNRMSGTRWLFLDGREIGERSTQYSHADLTQGCYCTLASVYRSSYGSTEEIATAKSDYTLVTSCTPDFSYWWDGQYAMKRMGGTLTMDLGRNPQYEVMYCKAEAAKVGEPPTTSGKTIVLIDWPATAQADLEVTLPSNVKYFDGADDLCPGYDIQSELYPNTLTATALSANQVTNCTCYVSSITAIGSSGSASSLDGNSFLTVCDESNNVFFNGKGFRTTRKGVMASEHMLTDYCGFPRQSNYQLAYVEAAGSSSPTVATTANSFRTSTALRAGTSTGAYPAASSTRASVAFNNGGKSSLICSQSHRILLALLACLSLAAALVM